jgi:hypothetical protein
LVVLEIILSHEYCDVDPINRLDKATPLHLAVATEDPEDRRTLVESLLDAGADFTFVRFILRSPTVTVVSSCGLDTGYGINTGKLRRNS